MRPELRDMGPLARSLTKEIITTLGVLATYNIGLRPSTRKGDTAARPQMAKETERSSAIVLPKTSRTLITPARPILTPAPKDPSRHGRIARCSKPCVDTSVIGALKRQTIPATTYRRLLPNAGPKWVRTGPTQECLTRPSVTTAAAALLECFRHLIKVPTYERTRTTSRSNPIHSITQLVITQTTVPEL